MRGGAGFEYLIARLKKIFIILIQHVMACSLTQLEQLSIIIKCNNYYLAFKDKFRYSQGWYKWVQKKPSNNETFF